MNNYTLTGDVYLHHYPRMPPCTIIYARTLGLTQGSISANRLINSRFFNKSRYLLSINFEQLIAHAYMDVTEQLGRGTRLKVSVCGFATFYVPFFSTALLTNMRMKDLLVS